MGKCRKCGKTGLFLRVNAEGLCSECAMNYVDEKMKVREPIQSVLEKQNRELKRLGEAENLYWEDRI